MRSHVLSNLLQPGRSRLTAAATRVSNTHLHHCYSTVATYGVTQKDLEILKNELDHCDGEIIDPHLHIAPWFANGEELAAGLAENDVSLGLIYNPYPKDFPLPYDVNEKVFEIASTSNGKIFCLASLDATHDNWEEHKEDELNRLSHYLEKEHIVLGAKLAPPNTCLPLTSPIIGDILERLNDHDGNNKVLAVHIGTTPMCGPMGKQFGVKCLCSEEYINPRYLDSYVQAYPDITYAFLHSGHEFLPPDDENYHDFKFANECIQMAKEYPNVYLSLSAIFAQNPDGTLKYPGGFELVKKMKLEGVAHKVFWASDQSFVKDSIRPALIMAIKAMIEAGFTQEERTWSLNGCTRKVFRF
eukprot:scaffold1233_cov111-Cylindrotheca_fusiformis.AAC.7